MQILISNEGTVKLCDFGFARNVTQDNADYTQYVVTRWYRPPELLVGGCYGTPVDVWAIGCLFSEMATGRPLFPGRDTVDQMYLTLRTVGELPEWQMEMLRGDEKLSIVDVPPASELRSPGQRFPDFTWAREGWRPRLPSRSARSLIVTVDDDQYCLAVK